MSHLKETYHVSNISHQLISLGQVNDLDTVSYTHLDVYKRQVQGFITGNLEPSSYQAIHFSQLVF